MVTSTTWPKYWDEERETRDPSERDRLILDQLQEQLHYVYNRIPFYRRLYDAHAVKPRTSSR